MSRILKFLKSEDGPTAVEYAVMLALIVVVCLTAVRAIGTNAAAKFNQVKNSLRSTRAVSFLPSRFGALSAREKSSTATMSCQPARSSSPINALPMKPAAPVTMIMVRN